ncbi:MAG: PAS domain-containing protein, partial [Cellvibrionaceae bacterium]|nr:PAS domain-containing protein [Cellvibrionaceae bacterium]
MIDKISKEVLGKLACASYRCEVNYNWTMHQLDDSIETISGYSASELLGDKERAYGSLIHPLDKANVLLNVNIAISVGSAFSLEYRIIHKSGEGRWVWEHGVPSEAEHNG